MILSSFFDKRHLFNTAAILSMAGGITTGTTMPDLTVDSAQYMIDTSQYTSLDSAKYRIYANGKTSSILETVSPTDFVFKSSKYIKNRLEQDAYELFGELRELNPQERIAREKTMEKISTNTGVSIFDS